jgi:hypothetical protein
VVSIVYCFVYDFDILSTIFNKGTKDGFGIIMTGFVIAGGSSGAIAIFQGFLGISKESRDAAIAARTARATADKEIAEIAAEKAKADKEEAEQRLKITTAEAATAEAQQKTAEAAAAKVKPKAKANAKKGNK